MTIKTEQLKHSMDELDGHLRKLSTSAVEKALLSEPEYRELVNDICDSTRDCLVIIGSIISDIT